MIVRGKRGNIVQTFPAVEYDFSPKRLHMSTTGELVHLQWCGSNTHNNGNPAGDGQAGDAGEGTTGTDRQNLVPISNPTDNYPIPFREANFDKVNWFKNSKCYGLKNAPFTGTDANSNINWASNEYQEITAKNCALEMATAGYYRNPSEMKTKPALSVLLNNANAAFRGMIMKPEKAGEYNFICTRNNNFSNRSEKGVFIVG